MYTSAIKTGMRYLAASIAVAAAAAVYGLFSHGVYSYFMTYAFMIPLLAGALPHLMTALRTPACSTEGGAADPGMAAKKEEPEALTGKISFKEAQLAFIVTLTAGSLLKGVLDIYGTTNRLLAVYPAAALLILAVVLAKRFKSKRGRDAD